MYFAGAVRFLFSTDKYTVMSDEEKYSMYATKCSQIQNEDSVRFAAIVDDGGKIIAGGQRAGIEPLEDSESKLQSFVEFVSMVSIRKDYDKSLGPINYLAARRDKLVLISFPFPVSRVLLLVTAEPSVSIEGLAKKVVDIFTGVQ